MVALIRRVTPAVWAVQTGLLLLSGGASAQPTCGVSIVRIDFESPRVSDLDNTFPSLDYVIDEARGIDRSDRGGLEYTPYTEEVALEHWTPNDYLAGYYGQRQSRTEANTCMGYEFDSNRNALVLEGPDRGGNQVLEVDLPKGCIGTECALQARFQVEKLVKGKLEEATLSYRFKFGDGFDFARGGKLPGFCSGPKCLTGCEQADGSGWSARHMWQECNPELKSERNCEHKFLSYLYHKNKWELCGDEVTLSDENGLVEPETGKWYTITSYIKMNTAGDPKQPQDYKADGIIKTWIDGRLLLDQTDMEWRVFNNVTIGYMYFSVFAGGADYSWGSDTNNAIRFDDFAMTNGYCPPEGAREALEVEAPRGSPVKFRERANTDVMGPDISRHAIRDNRRCWRKCVNTEGCVAAVRRAAFCYLKARIGEHLLMPQQNAFTLYPATTQELRLPLAGWNDPGDRSRPEICDSTIIAPLGTYKWPTEPTELGSFCQVARHEQCGGPPSWAAQNPDACCQGVLVCKYQNASYATCERPLEFRTALADPCERVGEGDACGNNGACCAEGLDCEYMAFGEARCAALRDPVDPFPKQEITCTLKAGGKCSGSASFLATFRDCCVEGLTCEFQKPTFSKCV